ncbi:MAG: UDP-N-acetylmuramate dehydrogenase [Lachnospiraceae bacterium]|nr:UDP-N-acetylmuramate dehydrogenase [Lachnospiraceae bacterium]
MPDMRTLLREAAGEDCILEQESMKKHTTFHIGGPADYFAAPTTAEGVQRIVKLCREEEYPFYVIGNGSNLLVSDQGYRGLVLQLYKNFSEITISAPDTGRSTILAQSGAMLSVIAKRALEAGLTGFEFASGIPGTLGGAVVMNAGTYGGEMKDVLISATVLDRSGEIREIPVPELALGYRQSAVSANGWIVLDAKITLACGETEAIRGRMEELKRQRVQKQPLELPSAGSTFKRPEGFFAGKLIMDAGLRGYTVGGAQVSEKHCGFVVNRGGATAADVRKLIADVRARVYEASGVTLEPEIRMLGAFDEDGKPGGCGHPAHPEDGFD